MVATILLILDYPELKTRKNNPDDIQVSLEPQDLQVSQLIKEYIKHRRTMFNLYFMC